MNNKQAHESAEPKTFYNTAELVEIFSVTRQTIKTRVGSGVFPNTEKVNEAPRAAYVFSVDDVQAEIRRELDRLEPKIAALTAALIGDR
jgi:hypothetical protein